MPKQSTKQILEAALKKIQKSNQWMQGEYVEFKPDVQGKTRHSFCALGAIRAAKAGDDVRAAYWVRGEEEIDLTLLKTYRKDPKRYGDPTDKNYGTIVGFNDDPGRKHSDVVRLFRDTIDRL